MQIIKEKLNNTIENLANDMSKQFSEEKNVTSPQDALSSGIRETQQLRPRGDLKHWSSSLILQMSKDFLSLDCVISLRSLAHHFPSSWCSWWEPEKIL